MLNKAIELAERHGWFLTRQFENEANADIHSRTTAQEILADFEDEKLDYWISVFGTGGTVKGVARVLKDKRPDTKIIVAEPDNVPLLASGIPQPAGASHPHFRPHPIQGTSPDFISKLMEDARSGGMVDEIVGVNGGEAMRLARVLAREEGVFVGISAGAALAAALEVAKTAPEGSTLLAMLPDTGERYLSTPLFEDIAVDMTPEEIEISRSTPTARFDRPSAPAPATAPTAPVAAGRDKEAEAFVDEVLQDRDKPVVLFALEWCEFCWSVRRMFAAYGVPYRSVDLDSAALQKDDWGGRVRRALQTRTGMVTIPQIFVGGELIGGATETFDAWRAGRLQTLLAHAGIRPGANQTDPYDFLPKWLHPRAA